MERVKVLQDYDGHWYIVPNTKEKEFNRLQEKINSDDYPNRYDDEDEFNRNFSQYMTEGDINNIQLYVQKLRF